MPKSEEAPYQWWLGDGTGRLKAANLVNPEVKEQPAGGVPVFFAVKRKTKGGALCHYGGHFVTKRFTKLTEQQRFKEIDRQALIELSFDHYDTKLAGAVDAIPADFVPSSSAAAGEGVDMEEEGEEVGRVA
tara:strand:+ start:1073 stop:1465 length:393 start_codon:yes stop_codon:yes gene_type:complete